MIGARLVTAGVTLAERASLSRARPCTATRRARVAPLLGGHLAAALAHDASSGISKSHKPSAPLAGMGFLNGRTFFKSHANRPGVKSP